MILSIVGFLLSFVLGLSHPKRMGWIVLATFPLLYAMYAVIIPSGFFPLNAVRFSFAVTMGVAMSNFSNDYPTSYLWRSRVVILLVIFVTYIFFLRVNESLITFLSSYLPAFIFSIVLPFLMIKNKDDLQKLVMLFAWQGAVIGFFVITEYLFEYNPYDFFLTINQSIEEISNYESEIIYRGGFKRVAGLAGNAVDTGYLLALFFPLSLWLLLQKGLISKIPATLCIAGIVLLQTRATFLALGISAVVFLLFSLYHSNQNSFVQRIFTRRVLLISAMIVVVGVTFFPFVTTLMSGFFEGLFTESEGFGVATKINRLPRAYGFFMQNPFGYGSPTYAYETIMNSSDLPAPVIYFLSGGILLGVVYLLYLLHLPFSTFRVIKKQNLQGPERLFILLIACALLSSIIVVFSNWREKHLLSALFLYISVFKLYFLNTGDSLTDSRITHEKE